MTYGLVYLHGFASGPGSLKAQHLRAQLGHKWLVDVADLEGGAFTHLTAPAMLERAHQSILQMHARCDALVVVGSSLGGYLAAYGAATWPHLAKWAGILLLAPAFNFLSQWNKHLGDEFLQQWKHDGVQSFFHYGDDCEHPLNYAFYESCTQYPPYPGKHTIPTSIIHGDQDDVVSIEGSHLYLQQLGHGHLITRPSDHSLSGAEDLAVMVQQCKELITLPHH